MSCDVICAHTVVVGTGSWHSARCNRWFCDCFFGGLGHFHSHFYGGRSQEHLAPSFVEILIVIAIVVPTPNMLLEHGVCRTLTSQSTACSAISLRQQRQACISVKIVFVWPPQRQVIRGIDADKCLFSIEFVAPLFTVFSHCEMRCVRAAGRVMRYLHVFTCRAGCSAGRTPFCAYIVPSIRPNSQQHVNVIERAMRDSCHPVRTRCLCHFGVGNPP